MTPAPAGAPSGEAVLGLVRTAGLDLALPLAVLREVVPCPDVLGELPTTAPGLLGVLPLRGTMVPVLDLAQALGRPHGRAPEQVVVVLTGGGQVLGLLVDTVRGLTTVRDDDTARVRAEGEGLLFTRTFVDPGTGGVVSVLDPDALLGLPGVPVVLEQPREAVAAGTADGGPARTLTLVRCGPFTLALDVSAVHSTVPSPVLRPSPADGPTCLGVTPVAGAEVAVADLLALLGLGSQAGVALDCGLVLDLPDGQVVLGVGAMVGLHDVPASAVVPLPAAASPVPFLLHDVAEVPGVGACLLVDGARLLATADLGVLSRITTRLDDEEAATARAAATGPSHLAYRAGPVLATPLEQVVEVLAYPQDLVPSRGAPHVLGLVVHRGVAVPVLDLASALDRPATAHTPTSRLLLLDVDGEPAAYAVSGLIAILPLAWSDPSPAGRPQASVLQRCPLVQLDTLEGLVPRLDLRALTRELRGTPAVAVPSPRDGAEVAQPA